MDRKIIYIGGGAVLLLVLVFAVIAVLGNKNKSTQSKTTTLTIWDSFDSEDDLKEIINSFQQRNKNIEVKFVKKNPAAYETESINAIAAGQGPDIWVIPNTWMPKHHNKLAPLTEKTLDPKKKKSNDEIYKDTFLPAAHQDNVIEGKVYGMPLFIDSLVLFFNNQVLQKKYSEYLKKHPEIDINSGQSKRLINPPETWDDLTEQVKNLGTNIIALGDSNKIERASDILIALMLQNGAQMTTDNHDAALFQTSANLFGETAYPGTKALEFYTSFAQKNNPNYTWEDNKNSFEAFIGSEVAMMIDYSRKAKDMPQTNDFQYQVKNLPQVKDSQNPITLASYQTFTVPANTQNSQTAWDFIEFLTEANIQQIYLRKTDLPASIKNNAIGNPVDEQNAYAQSWYNPEPTKVEEIFKLSISQTLGGDNPQTVLEGAAAQVTNLLTNLKNQ